MEVKQDVNIGPPSAPSRTESHLHTSGTALLAWRHSAYAMLMEVGVGSKPSAYERGAIGEQRS